MRKIVLFFLLFLFFKPSVNGQIDSLLNELIHEKTDTGKVLLHIKIAYEYGWNSPDSSVVHATAAKEISKRLNYQKGLFLSYIALSDSRYVTGDYGKGLSEAKEALIIARKNKREDWEMKTCGTLGLLYTQTGKYKDAIGYFETLITSNKKNKNEKGLATAINNLANCYLSLKDYPKSIEI
ncbi:MAG: tetratricopeptide repeat protein, partial [Bacteroidetes bacterium]|nr:tetratricopeptide repeat protein [Bacteroidota bacterium]